MKRLLCAVGIVGVLALPAAAAEPKKPPAEAKKPGVPVESPTHLQLTPFAAPFQKQPNERATANTPVTVFLKVDDRKSYPELCGLAPRIQDAMLLDFSSKPVLLRYLVDPKALEKDETLAEDRSPEQQQIDTRLLKIVNGAIGKPAATGILVLRGARATGDKASKVPFAAASCSELEGGGDKKGKSKPKSSSSH